jgi:hypothetical protein
MHVEDEDGRQVLVCTVGKTVLDASEVGQASS